MFVYLCSYEKLSRLWPSVDDYRYYYVQSLYKAGALPEALRACQGVQARAARLLGISKSNLSYRIRKLAIAIRQIDYQ